MLIPFSSLQTQHVGMQQTSSCIPVAHQAEFLLVHMTVIAGAPEGQVLLPVFTQTLAPVLLWLCPPLGPISSQLSEGTGGTGE